MSVLGSKNSSDSHLLRINPKSQLQCRRPCVLCPHFSTPSPAPHPLSPLAAAPPVSLTFLKYAKLIPASGPLHCFFPASSTPHRCPQVLLLYFFRFLFKCQLCYNPSATLYFNSNPMSSELSLNLLYFFSKHLSPSDIFYIQYCFLYILHILYCTLYVYL